MAEEVGFEPTVSLHPQRFSRPSHSAALAPFRPQTLSAGAWGYDRSGAVGTRFQQLDQTGLLRGPTEGLPGDRVAGRTVECHGERQEPEM